MLRHPRHGARRVLAAVATTAMVLSFAPVPAEAAVPAITVSSVAAGFDAPTQVTSAKDGSKRLFVVEQRGTIRVVKE